MMGEVSLARSVGCLSDGHMPCAFRGRAGWSTHKQTTSNFTLAQWMQDSVAVDLQEHLSHKKTPNSRTLQRHMPGPHGVPGGGVLQSDLVVILKHLCSNFRCQILKENVFPPDEGAPGQGPLGPLGFNFSQHGPTTRPSVERTAEKAFLLPDRV